MVPRCSSPGGCGGTRRGTPATGKLADRRDQARVRGTALRSAVHPPLMGVHAQSAHDPLCQRGKGETTVPQARLREVRGEGEEDGHPIAAKGGLRERPPSSPTVGLAVDKGPGPLPRAAFIFEAERSTMSRVGRVPVEEGSTDPRE